MLSRLSLIGHGASLGRRLSLRGSAPSSSSLLLRSFSESVTDDTQRPSPLSQLQPLHPLQALDQSETDLNITLMARKKLESMDYRSLQKLASHFHLPGRVGRDELVDKIITLQKPYSVAENASGAEDADDEHKIVNSIFFRYLEPNEIKHIAKAVGVSDSLRRRDLIRLLSEEKKVTVALAKSVLAKLPRRERLRRKNSIFDDDEFFLAQASSSSSSSAPAPAPVAEGAEGDAVDPTLKAFRQFLKMKLSALERDEEEILPSAPHTHAEATAAEAASSSAASTTDAAADAAADATARKRKKSAKGYKPHMVYTIDEAERFLSYLQEETTRPEQTVPSAATLSLYHNIAEDALHLYTEQLHIASPDRRLHEKKGEQRVVPTPPHVPRVLRLYRPNVAPRPPSQQSARKLSGREKAAEAAAVRKRPLTVVGDIAGHFPNLLHVMSEAVGGFPAAENPFVFMGNLLSPPLFATFAHADAVLQRSAADTQAQTEAQVEVSEEEEGEDSVQDEEKRARKKRLTQQEAVTELLAAAHRKRAKANVAKTVLANSLASFHHIKHSQFAQLKQVEGLKCLFALLYLKLTMPSAVHILRSDETLAALFDAQEAYSLLTEEEKESLSAEEKSLHELWTKLHRLYDQLPLAAIVDGAAFISHSGPGVFTSKMSVDEIERSTEEDLVLQEFTLAEPTDDKNLTPKQLAKTKHAMEKFKGFSVYHRHLNGFLRRNELQLMVRASKGFLPTGFTVKNDRRVISLYSCPHIVADESIEEEREGEGEERETVAAPKTPSPEVSPGYNTGAVIRFEYADVSNFQIVTFLSRIEDIDEESEYTGPFL